MKGIYKVFRPQNGVADIYHNIKLADYVNRMLGKGIVKEPLVPFQARDTIRKTETAIRHAAMHDQLIGPMPSQNHDDIIFKFNSWWEQSGSKIKAINGRTPLIENFYPLRIYRNIKEIPGELVVEIPDIFNPSENGSFERSFTYDQYGRLTKRKSHGNDFGCQETDSYTYSSDGYLTHTTHTLKETVWKEIRTNGTHTDIFWTKPSEARLSSISHINTQYFTESNLAGSLAIDGGQVYEGDPIISTF